MDQLSRFFAEVLPTQGFRYIAAFFPDGEGRPAHKDFPPGESKELISYAQWCVRKNAEVYFAVGGYLPTMSDGGKMRRTAVCSRWHRSMRLDLDVGPGKHASKRDAVIALDAFIARYHLPKPWLVDSGYGIHVYWAFDQDIPLEEWWPLADRLKDACMSAGFGSDHTTTIDSARILRFPTTVNRKHAGAVPVRILAAGVAVSPQAFAAMLPASTGLGHGPTVGQARVVSELQQGLHPAYFLRGVMTRCPGVAAMVLDKGANAREPLWKATLDLVNRAADSEDTRERVARHLSSGHAGYSEGAFASKWAQTRQQGYEPPTCARMAAAGTSQCGTCPFKGSISSPVVLGRPMAVAPAQAPGAVPLPLAAVSPALLVQHAGAAPSMTSGVFVITTGQSAVAVIDGPLTKNLAISHGMPSVRVEIKNDDGSVRDWWKPICQYRIVEVERLLDKLGQQAITAITFDRHTDKVLRVEFSHADLSEPRSFNAKIGAAGLHMSRKDAAFLQDTFMAEFLQQLQRARAANKIAGHNGWNEDRSEFVLGTRLFTKDNTEWVRPTLASQSEMEAYHVAGEREAWEKAFDIALSGGADRQTVLALAIAAPLMVFTGVDGLLLNAYSPESGVGKSTLCDAALSIWGAPDRLRKDFRDTPNATFKLASIVGNLPMVVDEFTNVEGKQLSDYVYTITQGREKNRLSADSKLNAIGSRWCLPTITTSNNSVHEKLQAFRSDAVAEAARVFELRLRPLPFNPEQLQYNKMALQGLRTNYGFLGEQIVNLYLQRSPDAWRQILSDRIAFWDRECAQDASDRFRSACAALCEIGAAVGKALGFAFDPAEVREVLRAQWGIQQAEFDSQRKSPSDVVNDYLVTRLPDMVMVGGVNADSLISGVPRSVAGEIRGHSVGGKFSAEHVMIPLELIRNHSRDSNISYKLVLEWIRSEMTPKGLVSRMGNLVFLRDTIQQVTTPAVEFRAALLGGAALSVVPNTTPSHLENTSCVA